MADTPESNSFTYPVLIADDNQLLRNILEAALKSAGYQVVSATNGKEALEIFRKGYYPIVMTDWVMPEMDGLELCRAIRADDAERYTYIILLTSQDSKNDIIAGLEAGADEYLIKPVNQTELVTRLKTARRVIDLERSLHTILEENRSLAFIDPLTGIYNSRYMDQRIPQEVKRAYRYERALSLIFLEINNFEEITDTHGHFAGDVVLKGCADTLLDSVRKEVDWLARYGAEKYLVVLPETEMSEAMILAKRLRIRLGSTPIKVYDKEIRISANFGVSSFTGNQQRQGITAQLLMDRADRCLCETRAEGSEAIKGVQLS